MLRIDATTYIQSQGVFFQLHVSNIRHGLLFLWRQRETLGAQALCVQTLVLHESDGIIREEAV